MRDVTPITDLADDRVAAYRNLKDHELDREGRLFIAEGDHVVRRLLASDFEVRSVLLSEKRRDAIAPLVPEHVPVYVATDPVLRQILGYKFHAGALACGVRKPRATIDELLPKDKPSLLVVVCPDLANAENVGSLMRLAAGFGADALLLGEHSHDPFWRISIRVSMGAAFRLPIVHTDDVRRDLHRLRDEWGVRLVATVLHDDATPIERVARPPKLGLLVGNEAQGLADDVVALCHDRAIIPMHHGTDSLNVAVATGIFLYHFTRGSALEDC